MPDSLEVLSAATVRDVVELNAVERTRALSCPMACKVSNGDDSVPENGLEARRRRLAGVLLIMLIIDYILLSS